MGETLTYSNSFLHSVPWSVICLEYSHQCLVLEFKLNIFYHITLASFNLHLSKNHYLFFFVLVCLYIFVLNLYIVFIAMKTNLLLSYCLISWCSQDLQPHKQRWRLTWLKIAKLASPSPPPVGLVMLHFHNSLGHTQVYMSASHLVISLIFLFFQFISL